MHFGGSAGCGDDKVIVGFGTGNHDGSASGSVIDRGNRIGSGQIGIADRTCRAGAAHDASMGSSSPGNRRIIGRGLGIGPPRCRAAVAAGRQCARPRAGRMDLRRWLRWRRIPRPYDAPAFFFAPCCRMPNTRICRPSITGGLVNFRRGQKAVRIWVDTRALNYCGHHFTPHKTCTV